MKKRWLHSVTVDDYLEAWAALKKLRREAEAKRVLFENNMHKIDSLVRAGAKIKVEFGAGERRGTEGWICVDKVHGCDLVLDLTQPLLFPDDCVAEIYSSHLLEHFTFREAGFFLKECHRILAPGGTFRAAVPNARLFLQAYSGEDAAGIRQMCSHAKALNGSARIDLVNYIAYMDGFHKYMYDEDNLVDIVAVSGFSNVRVCDYDDTIDMAERRAMSVYVQADK